MFFPFALRVSMQGNAAPYDAAFYFHYGQNFNKTSFFVTMGLPMIAFCMM
jgi:hypothetical protein